MMDIVDCVAAVVGLGLTIAGMTQDLVTVNQPDFKGGIGFAHASVETAYVGTEPNPYWIRDESTACGADFGTHADPTCKDEHARWCHAVIGTASTAVVFGFAAILFLCYHMWHKTGKDEAGDNIGRPAGYRWTIMLFFLLAASPSMYISGHSTLFAVSGAGQCGFNDEEKAHIGIGAYLHLGAGLMYITFLVGHALYFWLWDPVAKKYNLNHKHLATAGYVMVLAMMLTGNMLSIVTDNLGGTLHSGFGTGLLGDYHTSCDAKEYGFALKSASGANNYCRYLPASFLLPAGLAVIGIFLARAGFANAKWQTATRLVIASGVFLTTSLTTCWTAYLFDTAAEDDGLVRGEVVTWGPSFYLAAGSFFIAAVLLILIVLVESGSKYAERFQYSVVPRN